MDRENFWLHMTHVPRIVPQYVYKILDKIDEGNGKTHLNCAPPPPPKYELSRVHTNVIETIPARKK